MSTALRQPPKRMNLAEFLDWDPGDSTRKRWQLVDGEPVAMAPGSDTHGSIQSELARLIGNHLVAARSQCRVVTEPGIVPRVSAAWNFRIPDLVVTCEPPTREVIVPDPVLIVEILSPGNQAATRANIWAFTTIPSAQEILVIHSTRRAAERLLRRADGQWPEQADLIDADGALALASIGFQPPLAAAYRTTLLAA